MLVGAALDAALARAALDAAGTAESAGAALDTAEPIGAALDAAGTAVLAGATLDAAPGFDESSSPVLVDAGH